MRLSIIYAGISAASAVVAFPFERRSSNLTSCKRISNLNKDSYLTLLKAAQDLFDFSMSIQDARWDDSYKVRIVFASPS